VADLLERRVAVLVTTGTLAALEAKRATATTPIVFALGADPVKFGLVASLNRPGGNATGVSFLVNTMMAKQFEILHQTVPKATVVGFLVNPVNPNTDPDTKDVEAAAERLGHKLRVVNASTEREIDTAIKTFVDERIHALFVHNDPLLLLRREQIVALAAYHAIPAMYAFSEFAVAGGLMSYGTDRVEPYRLAGEYCGQILKGAKPADLPVQLSTKFEFVINMKTAKALGLEIPLPLLVAADEVIE
jgi:putative tryptophan/tyrosine transport system substrate-binding protein